MGLVIRYQALALVVALGIPTVAIVQRRMNSGELAETRKTPAKCQFSKKQADFIPFGEDTRQALERARGLAVTVHNDAINSAHVAIGLLGGHNPATDALHVARVDTARLARRLRALLPRTPDPVEGPDLPYDASGTLALCLAIRHAQQRSSREVTTFDLLAALTRVGTGSVVAALHHEGIDSASVEQIAAPRTVNVARLVQGTAALFHDAALQPFGHFLHALNRDDRRVLYVLLVAAVVLGFVFGRRRTPRTGSRRPFGVWRFPSFQNGGEARVSRVLLSHFGPPDYHLMNHITIQMEDGTTQVDHILVSKFGVFVIETKDYKGWIFANPTDATWTQTIFRRKFKFQNPLFQNKRHIRAVQGLLDFLSPEVIKSIVVFTGDAEFRTPTPEGVIMIDQLAEYLRHQTEAVMSLDRLQFCVGRLETARLAISGETDVEHIRSLARRHGSTARAFK